MPWSATSSARSKMHPERSGDQTDWQSAFASPLGAALVREAAAEERKGVASLSKVVESL